VLDVKHLHLAKATEQLPGLGRVVSAAGEVLDHLLLPRDALLADGDMPFGHLKMPQLHFAIHGRGHPPKLRALNLRSRPSYQRRPAES
jgi:hypothetical protein